MAIIMDGNKLGIESKLKEMTTPAVLLSDLLVRPKRLYGEGRYGYKKRVCDENGLTHSMSQQVKLDQSDHHSHIEKTALHVEGNASQHLWNAKYARFCPHCLDENPTWRIEWELLFYDVCPKHKCILLDQCGQCERSISWKREHLLNCDCGILLSSLLAKRCSENQARFSLTMLQSIDVDRSIKDISPMAEIEHLSISEIQKFVRLTGRHKYLKTAWGSKHIPNQNCLSISLELTNVAADVLVNWPESFYSSLKETEYDFHLKNNSTRIKDCFGALYSTIFSQFTDTNFNFIREAFSDYVVTNWRGPIAERNKRVIKEMRNKGSWLTSNRACKELDISPKRLRTMIDEGTITGFTEIHAASGRHRTVVKRSTIPLSKEVLLNLVDLRKCARMLGVTKQRMAALRIYLFPTSSKVLDTPNSPWKIERNHIERIVNAYTPHSIVESISPNERSLTHLFKSWKWANKDIADLIEDVVTGKMKPRRCDIRRIGIAAWIFDLDDLQNWISQRTPKNLLTLSVPKLAIHLNIKQEVAYFLVKNNFIDSSILLKKTAKEFRISHQAITAFAESYAFVSRIAEELGTSSRSLLEKLEKSNIFAVSGPSIDRGRQLLIRRSSDLERLIMDIRNDQNYREVCE